MTPFIAIIFFASVVGTFGFGLAWLAARRRALRAEGRIRELTRRPTDDALMRAIDAVAIEVERLGEGQRYLTRLAADAEQPRSTPPNDSGRSGSAAPGGA